MKFMPWLILAGVGLAGLLFFAKKSAANEPPLPTPKFRVGATVKVSAAAQGLTIGTTGVIAAVRFDTPGKVTYDVNLTGGPSVPAIPEENLSLP